MASIRDLKRDIDVLMSMVLNDCFYVLEFNNKVEQEAIMKIAGEVIQKHREFRVKVNHPDGKDNKKIVKNYYDSIVSELLSFADQSLEKLSAEVKKVAN